jgi:hypothetical protein
MVVFGTELEAIQVPLLGNSFAVGLFSLLHILLAALSVGFMLLAPLFEWRGRTHPYDLDLALSLTRFTVVVFSVSTVLAVIMVELMIGLFPVTTMWIWNRFRVPILFGIAAFILQLFALYPYYHFWDALRRHSVAIHVTLGALAAGFMLLWVLMLDGMGSHMLTPVDKHGSWDPLWNPTWIPLALHRMGGNFMIAGYSLSAYGAWRARSQEQAPLLAYYRHLFITGWKIGLGGLLVQPFTGLLYALFIRQSAPDAYENLLNGPYRPFLYVQFILIGLLFVGNYLLLKSMRPPKRSIPWFDFGFPVLAVLMVSSVGYPDIRRLFLYALVGLTAWSLVTIGRAALSLPDLSASSIRPLTLGMGLLAIVLYLTMGTIRETSRRPDTVTGKISIGDELRQRAQFNEALR